VPPDASPLSQLAPTLLRRPEAGSRFGCRLPTKPGVEARLPTKPGVEASVSHSAAYRIVPPPRDAEAASVFASVHPETLLRCGLLHAAAATPMRLLIPDGTRRRELPCEEEALAPTAGSGRTVVVGIRRDPAIRELLTWALVKVANAGDRVAALHIVVAAADGASPRRLTRLICRIGFYFFPSPSISTKK
jgi:hypothetical protein